MGALIFLMAVAAVGACGVVLLGELLRLSSRARRWKTGFRLAAANGLVVLAFMAISPLYIHAAWDSPYGDAYVPYLLVPGIHVTFPADQLFAGPVFRGLLGYMESFPASVLCVIIGPGIVGVALGGVRWWMVGTVWDGVGPSKRT